MEIGVFLPNWVGDACMATPTLRALKLHFGEPLRIIGIGRPSPCDVLRDLPWIDEFMVYRPRGRPSMDSRRDLVAKLRKRKIDTALLLTNSLGSAIMAFLGGFRRRIGFASDARSFMLSDRLQLPHDKGVRKAIPAIDNYLLLAESLGCDITNRRMELAVNPADDARAELVWKEFGWSVEKKTIVINSSGLFGSSKIWPQEKVISLARGLADQFGYQILIHCGPAEIEDANQSSKLCSMPAIRSLGELQSSLEGDIPMGLSKAILKKADLVVSTDSGPRHIAVALNRKVVSLFGSTLPARTLSYNVPEEMIYLGLPCQPCYKRECPLTHHACMRNIPIDRVLHAIQSRMSACAREDFSVPLTAPLPDVA